MNKKVYIMRAGDAVKIGISDNPEDRLKQIQTSNHEKVELLASFVTANPELVEKTLHCRLEEAKVRGEWFRIGERTIDFIIQAANFMGIENLATFLQNSEDQQIFLAIWLNSKINEIQEAILDE